VDARKTREKPVSKEMKRRCAEPEVSGTNTFLLKKGGGALSLTLNSKAFEKGSRIFREIFFVRKVLARVEGVLSNLKRRSVK